MHPLLSVQNAKKIFTLQKKGLWSRQSFLHAVNGVTFDIARGETLGLVGESGCGKSTLARMVLRLIEPTEGAIFFNGQNILGVKAGELRRLRKEMQIIHQDPFGSLNPRMKVRDILGEPFNIHHICPRGEVIDRVRALLEKVRLSPASMHHYPHEFSGGQRQRIAIARALAVNPQLIVCDEPVSALDVSIQAQVINLLRSLQKEYKLSYLFISHDLLVIEHISDRVAIMYLGKFVELGDNGSIYHRPRHPYTESLLSAVPVPDVHRKRKPIRLEGEVPSPINLPKGCHFHPRCSYALKACREEEPSLKKVGENHFVACHLR